jgi:ADP-glucose pyrophosphorylase
MPGVQIGERVMIKKSIIMSNVIIPSGTIIEDKVNNEISLISQ